MDKVPGLPSEREKAITGLGFSFQKRVKMTFERQQIMDAGRGYRKADEEKKINWGSRMKK